MGESQNVPVPSNAKLVCYNTKSWLELLIILNTNYAK
jgi:hypothetical protein